MPALLRDMVAWLRFYLIVPIPPLLGESEDEAASRAEPTHAHAVQAVPLAGALLAAIAGVVLILAVSAHVPAFVAAVLALAAMAAATGAAAESGFAETCRRLGTYWCPQLADTAAQGRLAQAALVALVSMLLLRVGIVEGLTSAGAINAALALVAAGAVARAVAAAVPLFVRRAPASDAPAAPGESADLQYLAIFAVAIAAVAILPTYGVGAAIGGVAIAVVIAAFAEDIARRSGTAGDRSFAAGVEFVAETGFLLALLVIARVA